MKVFFDLKCPYCGYVNHMSRPVLDDRIQAGATSLAAIRCDVDSGGCDQPFAYEWQPRLVVDVKVFKLEGMVANDNPHP
jgi:hypothetical protein